MNVTARYLTVRPNEIIDRQKFLSESVILDLDDDGAAVGIEIIGDHSDAEVMMLVLDKARF